MALVKVISYPREDGGSIRVRLDHISVIETFAPGWGSNDWRMVLTVSGIKHPVRFTSQAAAEAAADHLAAAIERRCTW